MCEIRPIFRIFIQAKLIIFRYNLMTINASTHSNRFVEIVI